VGAYLPGQRLKKNVKAEEPLKFRIFKILVREHQVICTDQDGEDGSLSDSVDDEEWDSDDDADIDAMGAVKDYETSSKEPSSSPFAPAEEFRFLEDLLDDQIVVREDKEDPDICADPIYTVNLKQYITAFLHAFSTQNPQAFSHFVESLPSLDKKHLREQILEQKN